MQQSRLNRLFVLITFLLCLCQTQAQEVLNSVALDKVNSGRYQVRFKLNPANDLEMQAIELKIFRRRSGVIQEVFSKDISKDIKVSQGAYIYLWDVQGGLVKSGDDLQAKIRVSLNPSVTKQSSKTNKAPYADAGQFLQAELPVVQTILLNGSNSRDEDGKIVSAEWKQISGPTTLRIQKKDSLIAIAGGVFQEGTYAFELLIKDNQGATSIGRTILSVKPAIQAERTVITPATPKKDSVMSARMPAEPQKVTTRLKGGPLNSAINILAPGVGHYFVSGDHNGQNRKASAFILTGAYLGAVGGAFYFNERSSSQNKKYNELVTYREIQKDANGEVIGVRGVNDAEANKFFNGAKTARRNSLICLGVGGGILLGDLVYTFMKGNKNRQAWRQTTSFKPGLLISSDAHSTTVGVQFKF